VTWARYAIDTVDEDSTQLLPLTRRIDARFKEVPRCVTSRPGAFDAGAARS